jgi:apolipoprotein N-acyltransferase
VLGWVGLVPWLLALDGTRSLREALIAGVVMSVAFVLAVFGWFGVAMADYAGVSTVTGLAVLVLLAPVLQPQLVTFALARHVAGGGWRTRAATAACVWVGTEWLAGKLFGDTIGHGLQASAWLRQAADLGGAHGLTLVLLLANEHAAAVVRERAAPRRALPAAAGLAALALALAGYGAWRLGGLVPEGRSLTAAVVQTDLAHYDRLAAARGTHAAVRTILDAHYALSREAVARGGLDVLVWSETVYPTTFGAPKSADGAAFDREIAAFVSDTRVPLVFGAYDLEDGVEYNAAVFLEAPSGGPLEYETYRKAWLFPFTERTPALFDRPWLRRRLPWLGTWQAGAGPAVVALPLADGRRVPAAPLICYDAVTPRFALDAVRAGAQLIVTLSNDSWFAVGLGPRLHLVVAAFRSIETRRPQVRATTTGISAIITATGELAEVAGVHERAALVGTVTPETRATTLMLAWGDWLGPTALVLGVVLLTLRLAGGLGSRATALLVVALLGTAGCGDDAPRVRAAMRLVADAPPAAAPIVEVRSGSGFAFDVRGDPGEAHHLSAQMPPGAAREVLEEFRRRCAVVPPAPPRPSPPLDPAERKKLRALGYAL